MMRGWDAASFRDGKGRVYADGGRIFRVLSPAGWANWRAFSEHPLASELMAEDRLVRTWSVPDGLHGVTGDPVLEHEPVPFVSYAYEWPFGLLQRAALLHLELLRRLIPEGFILSDATPSNVMFRGIRPVFIDVGSIVPYQPGDVWQGFRQFLQTMLYPLLLSAYKGVPHQAWLRGAGEEGLPAWQVSRLFGWRDLRRPGVLTYVKLSAALDRAATGHLDITRRELQNSRVAAPVLLRNVEKLERVISRLRPRASRGPWQKYSASAVYGAEGQRRKREAVSALVAKVSPKPRLVWDLGSNTGEYSALVSPYAELVVAMDDVETIVQDVCTRCDAEGIENVLPLIVDITNPSPGQGWRGAERRALVARGEPDLILALALIHHAVITKGVPADQFLEEIAGWGRYCLVEHVPPTDPMVERLRRNVGESGHDVPDRRAFETLVSKRFQVRGVHDLAESRALYLLETRRTSA